MSFQLDPRKITETVERLAQRIGERFPESSLSQVSLEVCALSQAAEARVKDLRRSDWRLRAVIAVGLIIIVGIAGGTLFVAARELTLASSVADFFQGLDAAINGLIFVGLG